jgi:dolichol-phosphate mannosyltransferase
LGYKKSLEFNPDVVVSMDGDGNHDPVLLKDMFGLIAEGYDVVVGSRYIADGGYTADVDLPVYKIFLSRWVNVFLSYILGLSIVDKSSGYRCVRASFISQIVDEWHPR